jgi:hypothetical protein
VETNLTPSKNSALILRNQLSNKDMPVCKIFSLKMIYFFDCEMNMRLIIFFIDCAISSQSHSPVLSVHRCGWVVIIIVD